MEKKAIHFIGIGGIGVSALAQYYLAQGWKVNGSDAARSEITDDLKKRGVRIFIGQKAKNINGLDLVVYSAAIKPENPELKAAADKKIPTLTYAQAVGELTKKYFTIAVAGSHGKSTTTALIGLILMEARLDPTIIIGTKLKELNGSNFRMGHGGYLVLEADEYARSFYNYFPKIAVVTNIDKEHLDTYKNLNGVLMGFKKFFSNISKDGYLIANKKDENVNGVLSYRLQAPSFKIIWYGKGKHKLSIPGIHNQFNAEAAWQAVKILGVKKSMADKIFRSYLGAWRRLEKLNLKPQISKIRSIIYTDYAHHPTEIKATLQALREKHPHKKLICVFQPHQQDRLNKLFKEFTTAFAVADKTILYPLYKVKGRDPSATLRASSIGKTSADLVKAINKPNALWAGNFKKVVSLIQLDLTYNPIVVFMSAGDLDTKLRMWLSRPGLN